jgi:hypothetical protein
MHHHIHITLGSGKSAKHFCPITLLKAATRCRFVLLSRVQHIPCGHLSRAPSPVSFLHAGYRAHRLPVIVAFVSVCDDQL